MGRCYNQKMENILCLEEIEKTYGKGKRSVKALSNVSLSIPYGQVVGLVGPNGAGKSTLLKVITGLTHTDRGQILLFGQPRNEKNNRHIGYLPENPQFFKNISAREFVSFSLRLGGDAYSTQRIDSILSLVDLLKDADRPIRDYSKGMRQRVGLAQALVHQPRFLILDEPMSGLDPGGRDRIKAVLREYCSPERSVLFSSHDLGDVEDLCSRVLWVESGQIRLDAPIMEIVKQSAFEVSWLKKGRMRSRHVSDEVGLWSLLDEIRVSGCQLLHVRRGMVKRINDLLEIGRKL